MIAPLNAVSKVLSIIRFTSHASIKKILSIFDARGADDLNIIRGDGQNVLGKLKLNFQTSLN